MPMFWSKKPKDEKVAKKTAVPKAVKEGKKVPATKAVALKAASSAPAKAEGAKTAAKGEAGKSSSVIIRNHITEKSGMLSQIGVYTFQVDKNANKPTISNAIRVQYGVTPTKVAVSNIPGKKMLVKGRPTYTSGFRKAVVTLKKGDKIDFA